MSSISYSTALTSNIIDIPKIIPAHLSSNHLIRPCPPNYQHLKQQVKPSLYGAGQRKYNDNYKLQQGTTTTFNGYTNFTGRRAPLPLPRHYHYNNNNQNDNVNVRYDNNFKQNDNVNRYNHYKQDNNVNHHDMQPLMNLNPYHLPSDRHTRSFYNAQQFHPGYHYHNSRSLSRSKYDVLARLPSRSPSPHYRTNLPPPVKPRRHYNVNNQNDNVNHVNNVHYNNNNQNNNVNNVHRFNRYNNNNNQNNNVNVNNVHYRNNYNNSNQNNNVNVNNVNNVHYNQNDSVNKGLILSDSMCSRLRSYAIRTPKFNDIDISFESGCDIEKMMNWLRTSEGHRTVQGKTHLIICLGTNDVGRYGVDESLKRCGEIIHFIRRSFPSIRAIGWLALSPRWKPTRFISAAEIGGLHFQFNERLQVLSKKLDFDFVDARLGLADMRVEDGLHPSTTTGRWKYEETLRKWFTTRAVAHSSSFFQPRRTLNYNNNNQDDSVNAPPMNYHQQRRYIAPYNAPNNNNNVPRYNAPRYNVHQNVNNNNHYNVQNNRYNVPYNVPRNNNNNNNYNDRHQQHHINNTGQVPKNVVEGLE